MTPIPMPPSLTDVLAKATAAQRIETAGMIFLARQRGWKIVTGADWRATERWLTFVNTRVPYPITILSQRGVIEWARKGWWPKPDEVCPHCAAVAPPGGKRPYTLTLREHCRSVKHIAARCGVTQAQARRAARELYALFLLTGDTT